MTSGSVGRRAKVKEKRNEEREGGVKGGDRNRSRESKTNVLNEGEREESKLEEMPTLCDG